MTDSSRDDEIVFAAGWRSAFGRAGGAFRSEDAGHLGAAVARETIARSGIDPGRLDEVVLGCVGPPHDQANIARVIAMRAGVPRDVPARTVARNCASGIESVATAAQAIRAGDASMVLAGGVEVMSGYPLIFNDRFKGLIERLSKAKSLGQRLQVLKSFRLGHLAPRIALLEGLTDPTCGLNMGRTAELLAREFGITRDAADRFARESHRRAEASRERGRFDREIAPLVPLGAQPGTPSLRHDETIRDGQTVEALAKLRPVFEKPDGRVTVGNACGITDGAVTMLVTTRGRARAEGLEPLARIVSVRWVGCDPSRMGLGPVYAVARLLDDHGMRLEDFSLVELNEAFAAQALAVSKAIESRQFAETALGRAAAIGTVDPERVNRNGGAIAIGHPVGATGARLLLTAAHELREIDGERALVTLCIGGGQGGAVLLERVEA